MKTVKIVLGIVIALSVAFLATGFIINELVYTAEVSVEKPVTEVFDLLSTPENIKQWAPEIKEVRTVKKTDNNEGSSYDIVVESQGQEIVSQMRIKTYVPNESLVLIYEGGGLFKKVSYRFSSNSNETTVTQESKVRATSFILGCMLPFVQSKLQVQDEQYLNAFKEYSEK